MEEGWPVWISVKKNVEVLWICDTTPLLRKVMI